MSDILVIDTNVLVTALLKADSAPAAVIRPLVIGDVLLAYDARLLLEYRDGIMDYHGSLCTRGPTICCRS